jgi:hypothetical protein
MVESYDRKKTSISIDAGTFSPTQNSAALYMYKHHTHTHYMHGEALGR